MDLAASIQAVTEEVVLRLTRALARRDRREESVPGRRRRAQLRRQRQGAARRPLRAIWIQPAAGDAGGALGAALAAYHLYQGAAARRSNALDGMQGAYLGPAFRRTRSSGGSTAAGAVFDGARRGRS